MGWRLTCGKLESSKRSGWNNVSTGLTTLTEKNEKGQETLRQAVEQRLDAIREENSKKLEEMRQTVDEKLQSTLEQRLGASFNRVVEQLERVHNGFGEMKTLAAGVGDLKKVLSNISVRGSIAEAQLGALLEQFLSREQYIEDAVVKEGSREHVEFAIRMPGRGNDADVLLPIDAKFPKEDYERLIAAADLGDADAVAEARKALEGSAPPIRENDLRKIPQSAAHDGLCNPVSAHRGALRGGAAKTRIF